MIKTLTPAHKKIAGLDHLRALAITLVFIFHYRLFAHPDWIVSIGRFGWTGVDLFFVLSGYLIASQVFQKIKQGNFYPEEFFLKRFFRILPAYWTVLALYFIVPAFREWESLAPLWKFLTFTQNFGLDQRYQRTFSHAWSLCIEEQFYLFFPLTVILFHKLKAGKWPAWIILVLFIAGLIVRTINWDTFIVPALGTESFGAIWFKWIYYPTYNRLDGILAGVSIAGCFHFFPRITRAIEKHTHLALAAGIALATCAYVICLDLFSHTASVWGFPLVAMAYGLIVASAACPRGLLNRFTSRITSAIATLSYAIYLTHKAAIHFTQVQFSKLHIEASGNLMFILSIVISILFSLILHYMVEKPFLNLRDRILRKQKKIMPLPVKQAI